MDTVGIALIAIGVWVMYCGSKGIDAGVTALAIIRNPSSARAVIASASATADEPYRELLGVVTATTPKLSVAPGLNPFALFPVSDNWAKHVARGSAGGTDYVMPTGTPLVAARAGVVQNSPNAGAAGNMVKIKVSDGYTIVMMHLSRFAKDNGAQVSKLGIVGYSGGAKGAPGAGSSTGSHLHIHVVNPQGRMMPFEDYLKLDTGADTPTSRDSYLAPKPSTGKPDTTPSRDSYLRT